MSVKNRCEASLVGSRYRYHDVTCLIKAVTTLFLQVKVPGLFKGFLYQCRIDEDVVSTTSFDNCDRFEIHTLEGNMPDVLQRVVILIHVNVEANSDRSALRTLDLTHHFLMRISIAVLVLYALGQRGEGTELRAVTVTRIDGNVESQGFLRYLILLLTVSTDRTFQLHDLVEEILLRGCEAFKLSLITLDVYQRIVQMLGVLTACEEAAVELLMGLQIWEPLNELDQREVVSDDVVVCHIVGVCGQKKSRPAAPLYTMK